MGAPETAFAKIVADINLIVFSRDCNISYQQKKTRAKERLFNAFKAGIHKEMSLSEIAAQFDCHKTTTLNAFKQWKAGQQ